MASRPTHCAWHQPFCLLYSLSCTRTPTCLAFSTSALPTHLASLTHVCIYLSMNPPALYLQGKERREGKGREKGRKREGYKRKGKERKKKGQKGKEKKKQNKTKQISTAALASLPDSPSRQSQAPQPPSNVLNLPMFFPPLPTLAPLRGLSKSPLPPCFQSLYHLHFFHRTYHHVYRFVYSLAVCLPHWPVSVQVPPPSSLFTTVPKHHA